MVDGKELFWLKRLQNISDYFCRVKLALKKWELNQGYFAPENIVKLDQGRFGYPYATLASSYRTTWPQIKF